MSPSASVDREIDALLDALSSLGVCCHRPDEIRDYLREFPDLIEVIPQAAQVSGIQEIRKLLKEAQLHLRVGRDLYGDRYLHLYLKGRVPADLVSRGNVYGFLDLVDVVWKFAEGEILELCRDRGGWLIFEVFPSLGEASEDIDSS